MSRTGRGAAGTADGPARLSLPPTDEAPSTARHVLKSTLEHEGVPVHVMGRLLLITTELVTRALRWPASGGTRPLQLEVTVDSRCARVSLLDPRPRLPAGRLGQLSALEEEGLRFVIVDGLSDRWGLTRSDDESVAWSEVDIAQNRGYTQPCG